MRAGIGAQQWLGLLGATARSAAVPASALPDLFRTVRLQVLFTFVHAVPAVTVLAALGSIFVMVLRNSYGGLLVGLSPEAPLGQLLLDLGLRGAVPLAASIVVAVRSGTAISTELGAASVGQEVRALQSLGVNPLQFWVLPRVVGASVSAMLLSLHLLITALLLFWLFSAGQGDFRDFLAPLLSRGDLAVVSIKGLLAGGGIALLSAGYGLLTTRSVSDLPRAAAAATTVSVIWCVASSMAVTAFLLLA